jgi:hypothetical protein
LLTRTSTLPNCATAAATSATQSLSLPVCVGTAKARSPSDAATWCNASGLRAARTTDAPLATKARAMASPMPRLEPVTMATFPSSEIGVGTGRHTTAGAGSPPGSSKSAGPSAAAAGSLREQVAASVAALRQIGSKAKERISEASAGSLSGGLAGSACGSARSRGWYNGWSSPLWRDGHRPARRNRAFDLHSPAEVPTRCT